MLYQFSFSNYKSFRDEATLDLYPARINEKQNTLIRNAEDEKLLPLAVLYGPNGGGKTTVLESIRFFSSVIIKPIIALNIDAEEKFEKLKKTLEKITFDDKCFKFDKAYSAQPTSFDVFFCTNNTDFRYQVSVLKNEIVEENLYMRKFGENDAQIVFERNESDIYLGEILDGVNADKIKNTVPLLSYLSMYNVSEIDNVIDWLLGIEYIDYDNPRADKKVLIPGDENSKRILFDMLREIDVRIFDIRVEKDINGNILNLYTQHKTKEGEIIEIPFEDESSGTRKLFSLLPRLISALKKGNLVIADEMDAKLHPKLLRYIIELFTNEQVNKKGAQLLFTSHDLTTMIPDVFRRDEIWFCALNDENSSNLYSLVEFKKENGSKPRNDEIYGKQYLEGRYGADPYFRRILDWEEFNK